MRDRLIHALIQGDRLAWGAAGALWVLTAVIVLLHRPGSRKAGRGAADRSTAWTWLLLAVATGTSMGGLPLSAAISMPRVRWTTVDAPDLVAASGESWRRLRGPAVMVTGPDIAVPTVDVSERWMLYGLLSGKPAPGLPAAEPAPMRPGAPRLCLTEGDACRPWPVGWPDPARLPPMADLTWSLAGGADSEHALAYDAETGLYLRRIEPAPGTHSAGGHALDGPYVEMVGRVGAEVTREGPSVLFVLRAVTGGRLRAMRVTSVPPAPPEGSATAGPVEPGHVFRMQRAEVSLTAGPRVYAYAVRPVLVLTGLSLPLGVLALLLAPLLRRARGDAQGMTRREASAWIGPSMEAAAVLAAGVAAAAPAVVAIASLWGSR